MCHPAAPIEMKRRSILVHSVRRVLPPTASSCHRISKPPQLYSSTLGASARVTVVSVTCGAGAPTVVSFTVVPTIPRLPSASKGAHSRSCAGSVSACQTFSGECRSSLTRMSVRFSPSFRTWAPPAGPGAYSSRAVIYFSWRWASGRRHERVPPVGHKGRQQPHHHCPDHRVGSGQFERIPRVQSAEGQGFQRERGGGEWGHGRDDQQDRAHHLEHAECAPSAARERAHVIRERVELEHLVCPAREVEEGERDLDDPQQDVHRFLLVFLFVGVDWSMRSRWRSSAST